jgi:Fe-S cluster assembly ATP-binding protein
MQYLCTVLKVSHLDAAVGDRQILKDFSLEVKPGELHAIMGPNGSGKSTLAHVVSGKDGYQVTSGDILFEGQSILELSPEERARLGIFLAFQYPLEIPGVSTANFLKASINELRKHRGQEPLNSVDMLKLLNDKREVVGLEKAFLSRSVNEGFSGGEKKKNEIYQMAVIDPKLAILDETDSGLDIDALRIVSDGVNRLRRNDNAFVVITHDQRLLNYIVPDVVHVMVDGHIVKSGGKELALELEEKGYDWVRAQSEAVTVRSEE